jgi:hypothetical protein
LLSGVGSHGKCGRQAQVGFPVSRGLSTVLIENPPCLILVESELLDGVVLVLERHVPFADQLRGVTRQPELPGKTGLVRMQVNIFLRLAVENGCQAILERIASRQQGGARGRAERIGKASSEPHALACQLVDVWGFQRRAAIGGKTLHPQIVGKNDDDVGLGALVSPSNRHGNADA